MDELKKITEGMAGEEVAKVIYNNDKLLLDKIPVGDAAKVYQTTLDLNGIHRRANKAATQAEVDEVLNIISKYNAGYLVTIADVRDYPFRYGVVSVGMMDDANPITLIHYDDVGDVIAFKIDSPNVGSMWTVTNKTENKVYKTKLAFGNIERRADKAMTKAEYDEVYKIIDKYKAGYVVTVADESDWIYRYGTIAVSMQDDAVPTTLVVNDSVGNLIAFTVDDLREGALWTVTDKTSGGGGASGESNEFCELVSLPVTYSKMSSPEGLSIRFEASAKHRQAILSGTLVFMLEGNFYAMELSHQIIIPRRVSSVVNVRVMTYCRSLGICMPGLIELTETNIMIRLDTGDAYTMPSDSDYPTIQLIKK